MELCTRGRYRLRRQRLYFKHCVLFVPAWCLGYCTKGKRQPGSWAKCTYLGGAWTSVFVKCV